MENPANCTRSLPTRSTAFFAPTSTRVMFRGRLSEAAPQGGTPTSLDSCSRCWSCSLLGVAVVTVVVGNGRFSGSLQKPEGKASLRRSCFPPRCFRARKAGTVLNASDCVDSCATLVQRTGRQQGSKTQTEFERTLLRIRCVVSSDDQRITGQGHQLERRSVFVLLRA